MMTSLTHPSSTTVAIGQNGGRTTLLQDGDFTIGTGGNNRIAGNLFVTAPIFVQGVLTDQLGFFGGAPVAGNANPVGDPNLIPFRSCGSGMVRRPYAARPAGFNLIQ